MKSQDYPVIRQQLRDAWRVAKRAIEGGLCEGVNLYGWYGHDGAHRVRGLVRSLFPDKIPFEVRGVRRRPWFQIVRKMPNGVRLETDAIGRVVRWG